MVRDGCGLLQGLGYRRPGEPGKVDFVPLAAAARFPSLKAGEVDVLVRNTTWTLEREATLAVLFTGILYFDGQSFLVSSKKNVQTLSQLNGAAICVVKGTTHEGNLADYFRARGWTYQPVLVESQTKAADALFSGQCEAFTSETPELKTMSLKAPGGPEEYVILPDQISKEPLGPVVRRGDDEWFTIARWVLFALIRAEEMGITQANLQSKLKTNADPSGAEVARIGHDDFQGIDYPARLGHACPGKCWQLWGNVRTQPWLPESLKLERGLNRLWTQGGLMYSPPFH